jgi:hypothetical protein
MEFIGMKQKYCILEMDPEAAMAAVVKGSSLSYGV